MSGLSRPTMVDACQCTLSTRISRVNKRDMQKIVAREKMERQSGVTMTADKMLGLEEGTVMSLTSSKTKSFEKYAQMTVRGAGLGGLKSLAQMDSAVRRGRTYKEGTCAYNVRVCAATEAVKEAAYCWKSTSKTMWSKAGKKVAEYLSLVPRVQHNADGQFGVEVCHVILRELPLRLLAYEERLADPRLSGKRWTDWKEEPELVDFDTFKDIWTTEICTDEFARGPDDELMWCRPWARMPTEEEGLPARPRTVRTRGRICPAEYCVVFVGSMLGDPNGKQLLRLDPEIGDRWTGFDGERPGTGPHCEGTWQGDGANGHYVLERPSRNSMYVKDNLLALYQSPDPRKKENVPWRALTLPYDWFHRDHGTADVSHFRRIWPEIGDYTDWTPEGPDHFYVVAKYKRGGADEEDQRFPTECDSKLWSITKRSQDLKEVLDWMLPQIHPWEKEIAQWHEVRLNLFQLRYKEGCSPDAAKKRAAEEAAELAREVTQSSDARSVQLPPADADQLGFTELEKRWKSKDSCCVVGRLAEGTCKVSLWEMRYWHKQALRNEKNRLKKMYVDRESASLLARRNMLTTARETSAGQSGAREARDTTEIGMAVNDGELSDLTGPGREAVRQAANARRNQLDEEDQKVNDTLYSPGSWRCYRCRNVNAGNVVDCPQFMRASEAELTQVEKRRRVGGEEQIRCRGSQSTTWGGYVHSLDKVIPKALLDCGSLRRARAGKKFGDVESEMRRGSVRDRVLAKSMTPAERQGDVTEERREAVARAQHCHDNISRRRAEKRVRETQKIRDGLKQDPYAWTCTYCYAEDEDDKKTDVFNFSNRSQCYKCNRPRSEVTEDQTRWLCSECSRVDFTIPGSTPNCSDCGREVDWTVNATREQPEPQDGATPDGKLAKTLQEEDTPTEREEMPRVRTGKRKRGGKKHKRKDADAHPESGATQSSGARSVQLPPADAARSAWADMEDSGEGEMEVEEPERYEPTNDPDHDPSLEDREEQARPWRSGGSGRSTRPSRSYGSRFSWSLVALSLLYEAESVHAAAGQIGGAAVFAGALLLGHRTYLTADKVIEAAGNKTVQMVEAVGDAGISLTPLFVGCVVTIVLLMLRFVTRRWKVQDVFPSEGRRPRQQMLRDLTEPDGPDPKFPYLPFLSSDLLVEHIANVYDANDIAQEPEKISKVQGAGRTCHAMEEQYAVKSGSHGYTVVVDRTARRVTDPNRVMIRDIIKCTCPGYSITLAKTRQTDDRICKHAGAVLIAAMQEHKTKYGSAGDWPTRAESSQSSGARSVQLPPADAAPGNRVLALLDRPSSTDESLVTAEQALAVAVPKQSKVIADLRSLNSNLGNVVVPKEVGELKRMCAEQIAPRTVMTDDGSEFMRPVVPDLRGPPASSLPYSSRELWRPPPELSGLLTSSGELTATAVKSLPVQAKTPMFKSPPWRNPLIQEWSRILPRPKRGEVGKMLQHGDGNVAAVMNANDTVRTAEYLIDHAEDHVFLTCFTFDLRRISDALESAAKREVQVTVVADRNHTFKGVTQKQLERISSMDEAGVYVMLTNGIHGGIQHSKTLEVDGVAIIGSTNWTQSSLTNTELSVMIEFSDRGLRHYQAWKGELLAHAESFKECVPADRSKAAIDRFRTAKRFSVARARSLEARTRSQTDD